MPWIQLRLSANEETSEKYSDWLSACGAQAVTFIDAQDTPIYEPLPGDEVIYWHNTVQNRSTLWWILPTCWRRQTPTPLL